MTTAETFDDDGPGPAEDALFARRLAGRDAPAERAAFAARLKSDPAFRERFEDYRFVKEAFNPAVARALVPPELACGAVRRRFDGTRLEDGVRLPMEADRAHLDGCSSCALAWLVFAATGPQAAAGGPRALGRPRPQLVGLILAAAACLVWVRTAGHEPEPPQPPTVGPASVPVAAEQAAPSVGGVLTALREPTLLEAARTAADPQRDLAERRAAALRLALALSPEAATAAWALAAVEGDTELRRLYYMAADLTNVIPPTEALSAVRRELAEAESGNLGYVLALVHRTGAVLERPLLLDLARTAAERPGKFAAETQTFDRLLFALPNDEEAAALVAAAAKSPDPLRAVHAHYALAARAFKAGDDRGLDAALRELAGDLASTDAAVAIQAGLAYQRFAKGRHLAAVAARGVDAFAARWKAVLSACAGRKVVPTLQP